MAREPKKNWFDEFKKANVVPEPSVPPPTPSGSTKNRENRKHSRFAISDVQSSLYLYKEGIFSLFGVSKDNQGRKVVDLSEGGVRFLTHDRIPVGTKVKVVLHMEKFQDTFEATGVVKSCYQSAKSAGDFYSGIQFTALEPAQIRRITALRDWFSSPQYLAIRETRQRQKRSGGGEIVMPP